jgi:hypothetical protein
MPYGISPGSSVESLASSAPGKQQRTLSDWKKIAAIVKQAIKESSDGEGGEDGPVFDTAASPSMKPYHSTGDGADAHNNQPSVRQNAQEQDGSEERMPATARNRASSDPQGFCDKLTYKLAEARRSRDEACN